MIGHNALGAVGFAVTPATTSNTYNGILTLNITGLSSGDTVTVQKFLVTDGSNVVDSSGDLIQQFQLTDGAASVFTNGATSVTNFAVPGDADGMANGSITANLYPSMDFEQLYIGTYEFVVSSPAGHFSPITNSFTVTNFPFAQKITGNIISNGIASATLPYAVIVLLVNDGGNNTQPVAGAVADKNGAFSINMPPGTYGLVGFKTNFVTAFYSAPFVTVNSGATVTTNLSLYPAANSISGKIEDATSGAALGGMTMQIQSADGSLFALGFVDTNGNFVSAVTPGQWKVKPSEQALVWKGYDAFQNGLSVDTTTGSVSGLLVTAPKATAIFYGNVTDPSGNPLSGAAIESDDNNNIYDYFDGYSITNGNYVTVAVGGVSGDQWQVGYDYGGPPNYVYSQSASQQGNMVTLNVGQAVHQNFIGILATNTITGNVKFNGTNVIGVGVGAFATIDGQNFNPYVDTDNNGNFSLMVVNTNTWNISLNCNGGSDSLDTILGVGNYQCPNNLYVGVTNNNPTTNFVIQPSGGSGQIYGTVSDNDGNPVGGVDVYANDGMGDIYTNQTDGEGDYAINVPGGNYTVSVDCGQLDNDGYGCPNTQNVSISGDEIEVDFTVQSCALGVSTTSLPDGFGGVPYNTQLQNSGCDAPFTWSLENGSGPLPAGLMLSNNGVIFGTPAAVPYYGTTNYFYAQVTDAGNNTADQLLALSVYQPLIMSPGPLPRGTNDVSYTAQVLVSGGKEFYAGNTPEGYSSSYQGGMLPPGLNISYGAITVSNQYFIVSGTPTNTGTYSFTLGASDADGNMVSSNYSITIVSASLQITTSSLTNGTAGKAYTNQLQASGGTAPYTWSLALGSQPLPAGLALSTNGIIGGIPATNGTFSFIARVTDVNALTTTRSLTLVINGRPVLQKPVWLNNGFSVWIDGVTDQNYTVQMATNVVSTNWSTVLITNNGATNVFQVTDPNATNKQRYYRLLLGP